MAKEEPMVVTENQRLVIENNELKQENECLKIKFRLTEEVINYQKHIITSFINQNDILLSQIVK